jgi:hypothetical protein
VTYLFGYLFVEMDRARKKLASAIDGIRNNLQIRTELQVEEKLAAEHCALAEVYFWIINKHISACFRLLNMVFQISLNVWPWIQFKN